MMVRGDPAAICVVGAVIEDGSVLLVRRSPSARVFPDAWGLFGGHVERDETLEEALRREAREELKIEALTVTWLGQVYAPAEPAVVHVYAVSSWDGEPVNAAPEEHTEVRWFGAHDLPESQGLDPYRPLLATVLD